MEQFHGNSPRMPYTHIDEEGKMAAVELVAALCLSAVDHLKVNQVEKVVYFT